MAERLTVDPNTVTLEEAKAWLRQRVQEGAICPCCTQLAKVHKFKFYSGTAMLIMRMRGMCDRSPDGWVHARRDFAAVGINIDHFNFYKLKHWGLVVAKAASDDEDKNSSGYWKLTPLAIDFIERRCAIPTHVYFYDDRVLRMSKERITIDEALGTKFSYTDFISAHVPQSVAPAGV